MEDWFPRLRQSRVFQVVAVYAGVSWVILQVVGTLRENLGLPRTVFAATLVLLLIGFVVVLATAWVQSRPGLRARAAAEEVPHSWELDARDLLRSIGRGRFPHLTWARAMTGGALAFLLLFGFAGVYVVLQDGGRSFRSRGDAASEMPGLAVLPFAVTGTGLDMWREGMVDLLTPNLDGVGGLRTINARTVLARWREHRVTDASDLNEILDAARATGASLALLGSAVQLGPNVRLTAELHDLASGRSLGTVRVEGPEGDILRLLDDLSVDVVRSLLLAGDTGARSAGGLVTSSLPALEAFLEGEALYRRGEFPAAIRAFERAIAADSLFAMSYFRLGAALGWMPGGLVESRQYTQRARELADRLPAREAGLLGAYSRAMDDGDLRGITELEALVRRHPEDPEAWYYLGETYNHLGSRALIPVTRMADAFYMSIRLDSTFIPAYIHAIESAGSYGDTATMGTLVRSLRRQARTDTPTLERLELMYRAMRVGDAIRAELQTVSVGMLFELLINVDDAWIGTEPLREHVALEFLGRPDLETVMPRATAVVFAVASLHNRGKIAEATTLASTLEGAAKAREFLRMRMDGIPVPAAPLTGVPEGTPARDLVAASAAAELGDWPEFERRVALLREGLEQEPLSDEALAEYLGGVDGLIGWGRWRRGEPEAGVSAMVAAHGGLMSQTHGLGAVMKGLLAHAIELAYTELDRPQEALRYSLAPRADPHAAFRAAQLQERLGQTDVALATYRLLATVWADADADHPFAPVVRQSLAALGG